MGVAGILRGLELAFLHHRGHLLVGIPERHAAGNQFEGRLPASDDYKVGVYLMRSAARRDEIANYRLEMIID